MSIKTTLNPSFYHGLNKKPPFFEGWYYKLISADEKLKVAIIPGVIKGNDAHSFIQVLNGVDQEMGQHRIGFFLLYDAVKYLGHEDGLGTFGNIERD